MSKRVVVLKSESDRDHLLWLEAFVHTKFPFDIEVYEVFNDNQWSSLITNLTDVVAVIARPSGVSQDFKRWYDERLSILAMKRDLIIYPSLLEVLIYENKKFLSDWLVFNKIPSPKTWVFYSLKEFTDYTRHCKFPVVAKINIGASGKGVEVINSQAALSEYGFKAFQSGIVSRRGPNLFKGNLLKKIMKVLTIRNFIAIRMKEYAQSFQEVQKGFVLIQEYIEHDYEWRCVRIGDSFFAHKKLKKGDKTSGTLLKEYSAPPKSLLDFLYEITERFSLHSVAIDLFIRGDEYLVNEIQCYFGQSDPHQMIIDNIPGRYIRINHEWIFEAGSYNDFESYGARVSHLLKLIKE
ncbi:MAG: RimK family alpha-L-glutamate ligase [Flavobacteriales bacterium]